MKEPVSYPNYTVQELVNGEESIKEYVSSSGIVFAVSWIGNHHPDLSTLLGSHWDEYQQKLAKKRHKHLKHSKTKTSRIIVEKGGHVRSIYGKAYILDLMPTGVVPSELK